MQYVSTRGESPPIGFLDAVLAGLAPDGGLYSPAAWPEFSKDEIAAFAGKPYAEVAAAVLAKFAGEAIPADEIRRMTADAYAGFDHAAVTPLKQLDSNLWLLELFHGPTLAFKDVAMQLLARLYEHALAAKGRTLTIVCATSGDTGGAAVEALRGRGNLRVVVLFPDGRISEVQRRFMTCAPDDNVRCLAVDGTFDDCQSIVKSLFQAQGFREAVDLSGVNSINWARIAAQVVYYFTAAVALGAPERSISFAVPTGNFGDAFAGYVASRMGLPIERIILATNGNDILARAVNDGRYAKGAVLATQSPAMDIQIASNFERLYFEAVDRQGLETARAMRAFAEAGAIDIPPKALGVIRDLFAGVGIGEAETSRTILSTLNETGEMIDPHTAVGVAAAKRIGAKSPATPLVVLSTAHPAKFPDAVEAACGRGPAMPGAARALAGKPERLDKIAADVEAVKAYVRSFAGV
ncbi:threonine synthase [Phenylobacterium montanum]|uniref:Threonine synthase n=1 Tax=Phenylobacterium montanum TaxID=2823693 RepID=A0A975IU98_9CAUL|nr:threonine synthase [Caulobacter sp. S6]QUD87299.1 threonine synthase [Caulobacter sp. S6]